MPAGKMIIARKGNYKSKRIPKFTRYKSVVTRRGYTRPLTATTFPSRLKVKLVFEEHYDMNATTVSALGRIYSMNSPYDPIVATGGGVCSGFSQWAGIYTKYHCSGCKVSIQGICTSNNTNGLRMGMHAIGSAESQPADVEVFDWLSETKGGVSKMIPYYVTGQDFNKYFFKKYFNVKWVEGKKYLEADNYDGLTNGDPSLQPTIYVGAGYQNSSGNFSLNYDIKIVYYVTFYAPKIAADSE